MTAPIAALGSIRGRNGRLARTARARGAPRRTATRFEVLDRFSLRTRIGMLAALAAALAVVLVSAAAFFTVRANILDTLDENLLQRATAAAQSELVDPRLLATIPTEVSAPATSGSRCCWPTAGPARPRVRVRAAAGRRRSCGSPAARGVLGAHRAPTSGVTYRVVAVQAGPGQALVIAQPLEPTQQVLAELGSRARRRRHRGGGLPRWPGPRSPAPGCARWSG